MLSYPAVSRVMAGGGGPTVPVVDSHIDLPDSNPFVRVTVRLVPPSDAYPDGVNDSMHHGSYDGPTILRYDVAHAATNGHERRTSRGPEEIEFPGWEALHRQFRRAVVTHKRERRD